MIHGIQNFATPLSKPFIHFDCSYPVLSACLLTVKRPCDQHTVPSALQSVN